jgi:hypothetical protein
VSYQFWPPADPKDSLQTRLMPVVAAAMILLGWVFSCGVDVPSGNSVSAMALAAGDYNSQNVNTGD